LYGIQSIVVKIQCSYVKSVILYFLTRCSIGHTRVSHNFIVNEEHYLKVVHVIPFILYMLNIFHITVWLVLIFDEHFMRSILKLISLQMLQGC